MKNVVESVGNWKKCNRDRWRCYGGFIVYTNYWAACYRAHVCPSRQGHHPLGARNGKGRGRVIDVSQVSLSRKKRQFCRFDVGISSQMHSTRWPRVSTIFKAFFFFFHPFRANLWRQTRQTGITSERDALTNRAYALFGRKRDETIEFDELHVWE